MITREFDLMLYQEGNLLFINANQYDSGEQWIFTLYEENGVKYTPATGAIVGVKSDGHGIINTGTVDEYGRVVINETQQMTAAAGLATFELLIDNDTHGTANFKVDVEPRPADNADLSDSDLSLIQEAIDSAEVIVEVIGDGDPSEVIGEHVDAWLDNHPEATTTVEDGAITAPKINNSLWDKILVNEEASGAVASFDDGADDVPVSSLKVNLEPIQTGSGDPSPTNVRPISGHTSATVTRTGKNLIDESGLPKTVSGANYIQFSLPSWAYERGRNEDVTISLKGSLGEGKTRFALYINDTVNNNSLNIGNNQYLTAANNFTLKGKITVGGGGTDSTKSLTIRVYAQPYDGSVTSTISGLMLAFGDTEYEPCQSTSYPYSLGQSVYGGYVDLATGVLTVTDGYIASYNGETLPSTWISDRDVYASGTTPTTGAQVVYKLATPTTVQLTPQEVKTLLGYNNISSSGTVDVIYHADTKLYVDKMTNVDNAIIAPTEEGFTATRNYTVNDLLIVNDTLYKVTANIASGSAITPNSNVRQTTLSALIKALS